jgi:hypothetical protein
LVSSRRRRTLGRVNAPAPIARAGMTIVASLGLLVAAAVTLLVAPGTGSSGARRSSTGVAMVYAAQSDISVGLRVIHTDAHHAALAERAGYRTHIAPTPRLGHVAESAPSPESGRSGIVMVIYLIAAAVLGAVAGALTVDLRGRRRRPGPATGR